MAAAGTNSNLLNLKAKAKAWLAASLVVAFSLTGLVPAQAVDTPTLTFANYGNTFTGTTIAGFDPAATLRLSLGVDSGNLNYLGFDQGVTLAEISVFGPTISLEGTQSALNAAAPLITISELAGTVAVTGSVTDISDEFAPAYASADGTITPTSVIVGRPLDMTVTRGATLGSIDFAFSGGTNHTVGQLYMARIYSGPEEVSVIEGITPGSSTFEDLLIDVLYTVTVVPVGWTNAATGFTYTIPGNSAAGDNAYAQGSTTINRTCESYLSATYASNLLLNPDGTPIGCDYETQDVDLRPQAWDAAFQKEFGPQNASTLINYPTRLGWACDDCSVGAQGVFTSTEEDEVGATSGAGLPIGFDINFFGTTYSDIFVNSNGSVSFGRGSSIYNEPLNAVLAGAAGLAPFGVDLDNRDVHDAAQIWGGGERHADFFYWGRSLYEGKQAFVVTWMNSQVYSAGIKRDFNTFQLIIVDNENGDAEYVINYGSTQDANQGAGYGCAATTCLAAGFGSIQNGTALYASIQDETGYLYNGTVTANSIDTGSNALNQASLNSATPGRFVYSMVDGYVPEVATVPGIPQNLSVTAVNDLVTLDWQAPTSAGGAPLTGYTVRYREVGSTDGWVTTTTAVSDGSVTIPIAGNFVFQVAARNDIGTGVFTRSVLAAVAGPVYSDMFAYNNAVSLALRLSASDYTSATWATLQTAMATVVTEQDAQATVDGATLAINDALDRLEFDAGTGLIVLSDLRAYYQAMAAVDALDSRAYTEASWTALADASEYPIDRSSSQIAVDERTGLILAAIDSLVTAVNLLAYNVVVADAAALSADDYSPESWAILQAELDVPIGENSTQADVDEATLFVSMALATLVVYANVVNYNLLRLDALDRDSRQYTAESFSAIPEALATVVNRATDTQSFVDNASRRLAAAIANLVPTNDGVVVTPEAQAVYGPYVPETVVAAKPSLKALALARMIKKVLKFNVPVLVGRAVNAPVLFGGVSSQLDSGDIKALKAFATKNANLQGWLLVSGYVQAKGQTLAQARAVATARAKNVAALLATLGMKVNVGFAGFGATNTNAPKATDNKVEIRWVAAL